MMRQRQSSWWWLLLRLLVLFQNLEVQYAIRIVVKVFEEIKRESLFHRDSFASFAKKAKPRSSFDFNGLLFRAFAKLNLVLIFDFCTIRAVRGTISKLISVLIFDFCTIRAVRGTISELISVLIFDF